MKTFCRSYLFLILIFYSAGLLVGCQWQKKYGAGVSGLGGEVSGEVGSTAESMVNDPSVRDGAVAASYESGSGSSRQGQNSTENSVVSESKTITSRQSLPEKVLFQPVKYPKGFMQKLVIEGQRVEFVSEDGTELDGRYFRGVSPKHVVVFCHGNGGNLAHRCERMEALQKTHDAAFFLFDYRGYGRSKGKPTVSGAIADGRAAVRKAAELANVKPSEVILMGRSLGGAIATQLAIEFQSKGLIIESSFTSFKDIARHHAGWGHYMVNKSSLNSEEAIKSYRGKVLISHGTDDKVVPFEMGKRLMAAANEPKLFYEIAGGGHNDAMPQKYQALMKELFDSYGSVQPINGSSRR